METTGPGRPKKHKGMSKTRRKCFDRRKNDAKWQQKSLESGDGDVSTRNTPALALPKHWQALGSGKFCKIEEGSSGLGQIMMSLLVNEDSSCSVFVGGKEVPSSSEVLMNLHSSNAVSHCHSQCSIRMIRCHSRWRMRPYFLLIIYGTVYYPLQ